MSDAVITVENPVKNYLLGRKSACQGGREDKFRDAIGRESSNFTRCGQPSPRSTGLSGRSGRGVLSRPEGLHTGKMKMAEKAVSRKGQVVGARNCGNIVANDRTALTVFSRQIACRVPVIYRLAG